MNNTKHITIEIDELTELAENFYLLGQANERLENNKNKKTLSEQEVMDTLDISENDITKAEDLEIE